MGRRDPAIRRRQLVESAFEVLVERGTAATRLSDIADRAGVASSLVTYYFPNKDDLLLEATRFGIDRFFTERSAALARIVDAEERLEHAIRWAIPSGQRDADWIILMQFWARAIHTPALQTVATMLQTRARALYSSIIEAGTVEGAFSPVMAPESLASAIIGMIDGLAMRIILSDAALDLDEMERELLTLARLGVGLPAPLQPAARP